MQRRIEASLKKNEFGNLIWQPELDRVRRIIMKLARGHAAYELYPKLDDPAEIAFAPLQDLNDQERATFEEAPLRNLDLFPEIGTRAFHNTFIVQPGPYLLADNWKVVQPDRYRYSVVETGGVLVQIVLSEYLACRVSWE